MTFLSALCIPMLVAAVSLFLLFGGKQVGDGLLRGAEDGMRSVVRLFPTLVLFLAAVAMLDASGLTALLVRLLRKPAAALGIPAEVLPLVAVRPLSGSSSSALLAKLYADYGTDSEIGQVASVIAATSDTMFYIYAVYFSAAGVRRTRYAFAVGIVLLIAAVLLSAGVCKWML